MQPPAMGGAGCRLLCRCARLELETERWFDPPQPLTPLLLCSRPGSCPDGWRQLTTGVMPKQYSGMRGAEKTKVYVDVKVTPVPNVEAFSKHHSDDFGEEWCISGTGKVGLHETGCGAVRHCTDS